MEWISSVLGGLGGSSLQQSGEISRENLMSFFSAGKALFDSKDFCMHLRQGYERGESAEQLVNAAQKQIFESLSIHGDYGINYLAKIQDIFANDSEMLRVFWAFVHMEEKALDEAELDEHEYKAKYDKLEEIKIRMSEKEKEILALPEQERNAAMAQIYKDMVEASMQEAGGKCCSNQGHCEHSQAQAQAQAQAGLSISQPGGSGTTASNHSSDMMSDEEKLHFFQSLAAQSK